MTIRERGIECIENLRRMDDGISPGSRGQGIGLWPAMARAVLPILRAICGRTSTMIGLSPGGGVSGAPPSARPPVIAPERLLEHFQAK
jgi:hypothetical protein